MRKRIGPMGPIGPIRLMGLMGLIGLMGLMGCSSGGAEEQVSPTPPPTPAPTEVAISFSGAESLEQAVNSGGSDGANRAYGADGANETYGANGANRRAAGTPLSEKATTFHVWGYKNMSYDNGTGVYGDTLQVFPGYRVDWKANSAATTTTNSSGWEYVGIGDQTVKYWDMTAKAYRYFAVTGERTVYEAYGTNGTYGAYKAYEFSIAADASNAEAMSATPYFSKLWFSTGDPVTYADKQFGKPVTLEFLKPYARVRFLFKYATPREGFTLENISFKPSSGGKIARKGTVTVHYPTEGPEIKEWYTVEPKTGDDSQALEAFTEDYDPDNESKDYTGTGTDNGWYVVLPNNTQEDSYTLTVNINKSDSDRSVTVPAAYMQWLPGYSYTYIFKITEEGGVEIGWVEYAVTPWTDLENGKSVYNW